MTNETGFEVAVIGMAGRFPGANNIDEFWENLKNGRETISFFSDEEVQAAGVSPEVFQNPGYVKARGLLQNQEYFDSAFFNYTPLEAEVMDPQVRIFHECCWHALEHAGYDPSTYEHLIGLYAGASAALNWEAYHFFSQKTSSLLGYAASYLRKDYLCSRVSYKLGLKGPAFYLQTACSTSLVAIHLACQALINSECRMALAGGVALTHQGKVGYLYQEGMIGSKDGHCRAFDAGASGTIRGEGVGLVVLKMLKRAIKDRDTVHAVIKGTAINNDGDRKVGFTAPSIKGQAEVIWAAQQMAEVEPESIGYIETHGTGTRLGDPVEINALKKVFEGKAKHSCALGAVKTNIGHLDTAAGAAGVIKTILAFKHRLIPPSLNFETPNPEIDFENSPFYVNAKLSEWKSSGYPLRAGVSSFGIGGTNAHIVMEEPPQLEPSSKSREFQLFVLSAKTGTALDRVSQDLAAYLKSNPRIDLADVAYTLQVGRKVFPYRRFFVASDMSRAVEALTNQAASAFNTVPEKEQDKKVVFMFPGQGSQYENMGLDLYRTESVFREAMDRCFAILKPLMAVDLKNILFPSSTSSITSQNKMEPDHTADAAQYNRTTNETPPFGNSVPPVSSVAKSKESPIDATEFTQPLLFVFEYALSKLLIKWGIQPYAMIGHSIGEYVAACLAGVFSLEDALKLVVQRGKLMQSMPPGSMLSVPLPEEELKVLLSSFSDSSLSVAALNTTGRSVVSGPHEAVVVFESRLREKGIESRVLHTSHAFHSSMMDPILDEFGRHFRGLQLNKPQVPYISNVTGTWITASDAVSSSYWVKHLRQAVRFADGIGELLKRDDVLFVEVGPGNALNTFVMQHGERKPQQVALNLVRHPRDRVTDRFYLFNKIVQLWGSGVSVDWKAFYEAERRRRIPLPTYSFDPYVYPAVVNFNEIMPNFADNQNEGQACLTRTPNSNQLDLHSAPKVTPNQKLLEVQEQSINNQINNKSFSGGPGGGFLQKEPPGLSRPPLSTVYAGPADETEKVLVSLFESFFGFRPVGVSDNFYEMGGDSLSSVQLAGLIRKSGVEVTFRQILAYQSIREICRNVVVPVPVAVPAATVPVPGSASGVPLKGAFDEPDRAEILERLKINEDFTGILKAGEEVHLYSVSPVQCAVLIPPYRNASSNFIYYSHDFPSSISIEAINRIILDLANIHPLLRSVIVRGEARHFIREYSSFSHIPVPVIDISMFDTPVKKEVMQFINQALRRPIEVLDHVLFRMVLVRIDQDIFKLIGFFNHLIFDGTSIGILEGQIKQYEEGKVKPGEIQPFGVYYRDYVRFMEEQDYRDIDLASYLSADRYLSACEEVSKNFDPGSMFVEVFDLDISRIPEVYREHYEEVVLLAYGKFISRLMSVECAPITFVSAGRVYKGSAFNNIIGEFPDEIPLLFSFDESRLPQRMMEDFVAYKRFIRENNFNFYNYVVKGHMGLKAQGLRLSPFVYNSLMGSYDMLMRMRGEEADMQGVMANIPVPFFYMGVLEDYYAGKVGVRFLQNTGKPVKDFFLESYGEVVGKLE